MRKYSDMYMMVTPYRKSIIIVFFLVLLTVMVANAAEPPRDDYKNISWHITALTVTYDYKRKLYIARGDVEITGGVTRIEADYVEFNETTQDALAQGNVLLISGEDSISCTALNINLKTQTGKIHKGTLYISKNNVYIYGENIRKTGEFTYDADRGAITSCSGDNPDWKITGKDIRITVEGYGFAKDAVVWARQIPTLYTPYLAFPVKTKRQTGLLTPRFGSSDRKGFEVEQPLFLALSRNTDATVYVDAMAERGVKVGLEYRYVLDNYSKGTVIFDFLEDRKIDDGTDQTKEYSFAGTPIRENSDRYWFRMKHTQLLGNEFTAKLDLDIVSDLDYLREFEDGYTGFNDTRDYFVTDFGRSLDEYNDSTRTNRLNINRIWEQHSLNIDVKWFDNIRARQLDKEDTTLQSIPTVSFTAAKQQIGNTQLYYNLDSEMTYFYRNDTTSSEIKGSRADIHPRFYFPLKLGRYFSFEPSVGFRETVWLSDDWMDPEGEFSDFNHRETYDINLSLSTRMEKIYQAGIRSDYKIKHEIIPQIEYTFSPDIDQDSFPLFDAEDRLDKINQLTYSITNRLIARNPVLQKGADMKPGSAPYEYKELAWVKLSQSYYLALDDNNDRDFSDLMLDSEFYFCEYASLTADISWSPYDSQFNTFNTGIRVRDNREDSVTIQYRYDRDVSESIYTKTIAKLNDELSVFYLFEMDLLSNKTTESKVGTTLKKSCWSVDLSYADSPEDKKIALMVTLNGIGGFGTK